MSKPVESSFLELPLEMQVQILENIPDQELPSFRLVSTQSQAIVESRLESLWNTLQNSALEGPVPLKSLLGRIKEEHPNASHLQLFKRLKDAFARAGAQPGRLPLTLTDISDLQAQAKRAQDEALVAIWPRIRAQLQLQLPLFTTADQIRNWLNDPNNSQSLMGMIQLELSKLNFKVLPAEIAKFSQLQVLDLDGNQLTSLPDAIGKLTQLQGLYPRGNKLTSLPDAIGKLTQLRELFLDGNQLTSLPDPIGKLTQLRELSIDRNQLRSFPDAIGKLTQLQVLYLRGNKLTSLPDAIGKLTQLQWLDLSGNQLISLPDAIGKLTQLQRLSLDGNQLTSLPNAIGELTQLQWLYLSGNQLTSLPDVIGELPQLQFLSATFKVFVDCDVGFGNTLGIRCKSDRTKSIEFFYDLTQGKWTGQIPYRKAFKYVVISASREIKWEKGGNRFIQDMSSLQTVISRPPEF